MSSNQGGPAYSAMLGAAEATIKGHNRQRHVLVIEEVMNGYTVSINSQVMVVPQGGDLFAAIEEILVKSQLLEGK